MSEEDRERYPDLFAREDEDLARLWRSDDEPQRGYEPINPAPFWRSLLRRLWAPLAFIGLAFWKFKFILVAIFKFKIFTVAGSMLVSIGAYALLWGWRFAVGIVALLLIHELGHVFEAKRQGLNVSAPMFIPFLGAFIAMRTMPANVFKEAQMALAGPALGSLGAAGFWAFGEATGRDYFVAMAFVGFFLNLFNLAPITPLDGGRAIAAIHPAIWAVGLLALLGLMFISPNPILIFILLIGGMEAWKRWQHRRDPDQQRYYAIPMRQRVGVGVVYLALAALLVVAMDATFIERDI